MKKLLSVVLVLVMLLTQFVIPSFAYDIVIDDIFEENWEDPYKGLEVVDITVDQIRPLYSKADGYYVTCYCEGHDHDEYFEYDLYSDLFYYTVTYENGEVEEGTWLDLCGDFTIEDTQSETHWVLGKDYYMSVIYRNMQLAFVPEMVEAPVKSVTAVAQEKLVEDWDSYEDYYYDENDNEVSYTAYNLYEAEPVFTVTMKDGTIYKGTDEEIYKQTGFWTYEAYDQFKKPLKVGKNTVKFVYMGVECECKVEVVPNPYESITISGTNEIFLDFKGVDKKDSFKTKIVALDGIYGDGGAWGVITTEDGKQYGVDFYCYVDEDGNTIFNKDVSMRIGPFTTNTLETNNWLLANSTAQDIAYYTMSYYMVSENLTGNQFKGYFSDEDKNIDDLVAISTYVCEMDPAGENEDGYVHTLKANKVEENIEAVFGLTDVDVKKSTFYSKFTRKLVLEEPYDNGTEFFVNSFVFEDGKWVLYVDAYMWETGEFVGELVVILNEDFTVDSIYFTQKTIEFGDVNCDGAVTASDARLVLQYVAGIIDETELNMFYANMNGDENISAVDARMILQKVAGLV